MEERTPTGHVAITLSLPENLVNRLKRFSQQQTPSQIVTMTLSALLEGRLKIISQSNISEAGSPKKQHKKRKHKSDFWQFASASVSFYATLVLAISCIFMMCAMVYIYQSQRDRADIAETTLRSYEAELLFKEQSRVSAKQEINDLQQKIDLQREIISQMEDKLSDTEIVLSDTLARLEKEAALEAEKHLQDLRAKAKIQARKLKRLTGETPPEAVPRGRVQIRQIPPLPKQKPEF